MTNGNELSFSERAMCRYHEAHRQKPRGPEYFTPCLLCGKPLVRAPYELDTVFGYIHRDTGDEECAPRYASPNHDVLVDKHGKELWNAHTVVFEMSRKERNVRR